MKQVLITGANGFVGQYLVKYFASMGLKIVGLLRQPHEGLFEHAHVKYVTIGEIGPDTQYKTVLEDIDGIIHCAARVHVMNPTKDDAQLFYKTNVEGTKKLLQDAIGAGVKQFIYLSTIKVNGEETRKIPLSESDRENPQDHYAKSKWMAERVIWELTKETSCAATVLRLPLVYGPKVKGNLAKLIKALENGTPLPLKSIHNKRSLLALPNLASAIAACMDNDNASGQTFLLSDDADLSTPELIKLLASAKSITPKLLPCPVWVLKLLGKMMGRSNEINRLVQSLQVDVHKVRQELSWDPIVKPEDVFKLSK